MTADDRREARNVQRKDSFSTTGVTRLPVGDVVSQVLSCLWTTPYGYDWRTGIKEILTRDNRDSFPGTPFTPVRLSLTSVHCSLRPYHSSLHLLPCSLLTCGSLRYGTDMKNEEMSG